MDSFIFPLLPFVIIMLFSNHERLTRIEKHLGIHVEEAPVQKRNKVLIVIAAAIAAIGVAAIALVYVK